MMEEYIQVFTTTDSEENANEIAKIVLSKKLAGCTQIIGPIVSSYTPLYCARNHSFTHNRGEQGIAFFLTFFHSFFLTFINFILFYNSVF